MYAPAWGDACADVVATSEPAAPPALRLAPNPVSNGLTIETDLPFDRLAVYNLQGKVCLEHLPGSARLDLDVSSLIAGHYWVTGWVNGRLKGWQRFQKI